MMIDTAVRCAPWTEERGLDPIGTAGTQQGYLLVDWPLPWPRDVSEIDALDSLRPALAQARSRLQALVPDPSEAGHRVVAYRRHPGPFTRYVGREVVVSPADVVDAARAALAWVAGEGVDAGGDAVGSRSDVLVCTHGRRDRCCGSMGTTLAMELSLDPAVLGPEVRVSRTSHTGGHRYAPTAMVFPEGTAWAFADADLLATVVQRKGDVSGVLAHYRGCAGLDGRAAQAAERAVLGQVGWDLWDWPRWGEEIGDGRVHLHVEGPEGLSTWEVTVGAGRQLRMPECGGAPDVTPGVATEIVVGPAVRLT